VSDSCVNQVSVIDISITTTLQLVDFYRYSYS